ncbi:hypothetical protein [Lactiplantibacillus plantarum]|uniref:hypothetical protein n=1 Tax=Lactiplantibacillus plantarum TaxID=1590 RepID=UPI0024466D9A|nr:hypothetical protein [Lactiplantibacillus plantarum]MDG6763129.1 hypothetical protein [Lactiplantibacillus plantarum]MDH2715317.1 hypothetical protein [Lactiplantibacillus plantarum]MDH7467190.1 hypothetical protein [Lactiplantibacillus plantarum]MDN3213971.1 hypothetical protein [Lactiplantibacillus plantarum]MDN3216774.1 hypothetical protein [Lactiplantibacillus plantarum]
MNNNTKYSRRQQLDYIIDNQPNLTAQFVNMTAVTMPDEDVEKWFSKVRQQQIKAIKDTFVEM